MRGACALLAEHAKGSKVTGSRSTASSLSSSLSNSVSLHLAIAFSNSWRWRSSRLFKKRAGKPAGKLSYAVVQHSDAKPKSEDLSMRNRASLPIAQNS